MAKPCIVPAPTARCVTCTLSVLTLVTCITKTCRFKMNFSLKISVLVISSGSITSFFYISTIPTIQRHVITVITRKTFGKAEGIKDIFRRERCACQLIMTSLIDTKRFKAPQIISIAELGKSVITDVNSTSGDIQHCKMPLPICNWIFP